MDRKNKILVAPLNWGLGHAGRTVPIVHAFLRSGCDVLLAADGIAYEFLKQEFPQLPIIYFPGVHVKYAKRLPFALKIFVQLPAILSGIYREHRKIKEIVREYDIDMIVSDNRYGCYANNTYNVFITHQTRIILPKSMAFLRPLSDFILKKFISKFQEIWIPDFEGEKNYSGALSHPSPFENSVYVGILSRLHKILTPIEHNFMVLLSGPEPQRTMFEKMIVNFLLSHSHCYKSVVIVRGVPQEKDHDLGLPSHIKVFNHLQVEALSRYICESKFVICRSGYSTIMDLAILQRPAVMVPTPGQTEQEYLATYLSGTAFTWISQKDFTMEKALEMSEYLSVDQEAPQLFSLDLLIGQTIDIVNKKKG